MAASGANRFSKWNFCDPLALEEVGPPACRGTLMKMALRSGVVMASLWMAGAAWGQGPSNPAPPAAPLPGANSFMEPQARKLIESKGFSDVSALVNDSQGVWRGTAKNGSGKVRVTVDYKGNVSANPE
jgi:hypothetical protein